jgi:hypothetical protein
MTAWVGASPRAQAQDKAKKILEACRAETKAFSRICDPTSASRPAFFPAPNYSLTWLCVYDKVSQDKANGSKRYYKLMKNMFRHAAILLLLAVLNPHALTTSPQSTIFTCQGVVTANG